jgi:hypothetical protein
MSVVVIDEFAEDRFELSTMERQHPVEALPSCRADELLGERVRSRGSDPYLSGWRETPVAVNLPA